MAIKNKKEIVEETVKEIIETIDPEKLIHLVRNPVKATTQDYFGDSEAWVPYKTVHAWLDSPHGWEIKE